MPVVTVFLQRADGRILLLRRSRAVGSFRGRWAAISGFLERSPPLTQARREVREETGILASEVRQIERGPPFEVRGGGRRYRVHPFRFQVRRVRLTLDWEHTTSAWVRIGALRTRPTVPGLEEAWRRVRGGARRRARKR